MQMRKEHSEPDEYDFFPETYMLPYEMHEFRREFKPKEKDPGGEDQANTTQNQVKLNAKAGKLSGTALEGQYYSVISTFIWFILIRIFLN